VGVKHPEEKKGLSCEEGGVLSKNSNSCAMGELPHSARLGGVPGADAASAVPVGRVGAVPEAVAVSVPPYPTIEPPMAPLLTCCAAPPVGAAAAAAAKGVGCSCGSGERAGAGGRLVSRGTRCPEARP